MAGSCGCVTFLNVFLFTMMLVQFPTIWVGIDGSDYVATAPAASTSGRLDRSR
jgi:hypothetical protein